MSTHETALQSAHAPRRLITIQLVTLCAVAALLSTTAPAEEPTVFEAPIVFLEGHSESVTAVDWSPTTGALVTGSLDATVRMWDPARHFSQVIIRDHDDAVTRLALSHDGQLLASAALDGTVLLSAIPHVAPDDRWTIAAGATTLAIASDGAMLAVGYVSGNVTLHSATTGEATATLETRGGPIRRLIFEPSGTALVVVGSDGSITRWQTDGQRGAAICFAVPPADVALSATGDAIAVAGSDGFLNRHRWPPPAATNVQLPGPAQRIATSSAGDWHAVTGGGNVWLFDEAATQSSRTVTSPVDVTATAISRDGDQLLTGGSDGIVRQCPRAEGEFAPLFDTLQGAVHDIAWCRLPGSEQTLLATAGNDGTVRLWRYPPPPIRQSPITDSPDAESPATQLAVTTDGSRTAFADAAGKITVVDTDDNTVATIDLAQPIADLAFTADTARLVTVAADGRVRIHTLASGGVLALEGLSSAGSALAISDDGTRVAATDSEGVLIVWNPTDGAVVRRTTLPTVALHLAFRPGSHQLAAVTSTDLRLWRDGDDEPTTLATFPAQARSASLDARGTHVAVAGEDDTVRLYAQQDGLLVGVLDADGKPAEIALSPSGQRLASATDAQLAIWDVPTRRVIERRPLPAAVTQLRWRDDEHIVVTCGDAIRRTVPLTAVAVLSGHSGPVRALATGNDATRLYSGGDDATLREWNLTDTTAQRRFDGADGAVLDLAVSSDGRRVAAAGDDRYLRVWDTANTEMVCAVATPATTRAVRFAGDAETLIAGGDDRVVRRLAIATGNETERDVQQATSVRDIALTTDGSILCLAADGQLRRWTPSVSMSRRVSDVALSAVCFAAGDGQLATADFHGAVSLLNAADLTVLRVVADVGPVVHTLCATGNDGGTLCAADPRAMRTWNVGDGAALGQVAPDGGVAALAVDAAGQRAIAAGWDAHLQFVSLSESAVQFVTEAAPSRARAVCFAPDANRCFTVTATGELCRWSVASLTPRVRLAAHDGPIYALAFAADDALLASGGVDTAVKTWNIADAENKSTLDAHKGAVYGVAFSESPPGLVSVGLDKSVRRWDLESGKPAWELAEGLPNELFSVAIGGNRVFTGDATGKLHWIGAGDGKLVGSTDGHRSAIYAVRLNPAGTRLATLSHDGELALWNAESVETLEPLHREQLPVGRAFALAYSPDGNQLAVATVDRRLLIVTLPAAAR
ncbi:MAG: hypothetical protein R3C10_00835 [Pirellulales bacterium]